jgi:hypothetical protein
MTFKAGNRFRSEADYPRPTLSVSQISRWVLPAAVFGLSLALGAPAAAQAGLQPAVYAASVGGLREGVDGGGFSQNNSNSVAAYESLGGDVWGASASADDTGGGLATASAVVLQIPSGQETWVSKTMAQATIFRTFLIVGPDPDALIPVVFSGSGTVSGTVGGAGSAYLGFAGHSWSANTTFAGGSHTFKVHDLFYLQTNVVYGYELGAEAVADSDYRESSDAFTQVVASVDPTFQIQGAFAGLYHFVGLPASAIVTNPTSAAPEPASWAMMVSGFGLVGSAMRRRRLRAQVA